jgi:myosin-light-chain kinase
MLNSYAATMPEGEAPRFTKPLKSLDVVEGSGLDVEVRYTGSPKPDIKWFKDDKPIKENKRIKIRHITDDTCTLVISDLVIEDEASYKCVITNSFGKAVSEAEIVVLTGIFYKRNVNE